MDVCSSARWIPSLRQMRTFAVEPFVWTAHRRNEELDPCLASEEEGRPERTMNEHVEDFAGPGRLATWGSLAVAVVGVMLFGSVVAGVGDWMDGRRLQTVGPWAIPGLLLAAVAGTVAIRALRTGRGHRITVLLGLAVVTSAVLLFVLNPSIAPPVP